MARRHRSMPARRARCPVETYVDLGAENLLAAVKDAQVIAVEIKCFLSDSEMTDLERALGQFVLYRGILAEIEPERQLYLAIPKFAYDEIFSDQFGQTVIRHNQLRLIVFEEDEEEIVEWLP